MKGEANFEYCSSLVDWEMGQISFGQFRSIWTAFTSQCNQNHFQISSRPGGKISLHLIRKTGWEEADSLTISGKRADLKGLARFYRMPS